MTEHLPECTYVSYCDCYKDGSGFHSCNSQPCICERLRACEQRVAEETEAAMMESFHWKPSPPHDQHYFADNICAFCVGRSDAFTASHKAVAVLPEYALRDTCVSAIDALRKP